MSTRRRLFFALAAILAMLVASCAPAATAVAPTQAPAPQAAATAVPTQAAPSPTTAPESVKLTIWYLSGSPDETKTVQDAANKFAQAHPGVTIDFTPYDYTSMNEGIKLALDSHTGPDIAYTSPGYTSHLALAKAGHLVELTDYVTQKGWDKRMSVDMINYYNTPTMPHIWGVPYDLATVGVFYNKDIFTKQGLQPPQTFGDFETILAKLKAAGITPMGLGGADQWPIQQNWEALADANTPFENLTCLEAMNASCRWNYPTMVADLQKIKEWADKGYYNKDINATKSDDVNNLFIQGKIAMNITGTWNNAPFATQPKFEVGFFLVPSQDPTMPFHVGGYSPNNVWVVSKYSQHVDLDIDFIDYMLGEETATALWNNIGDLVMYKFSQQPKPVYPLQADEYTALQNALPGYYLGSNQDPKVQALFWPLLQDVIAGKITPQQALDQTQAEYLKYAK